MHHLDTANNALEDDGSCVSPSSPK